MPLHVALRLDWQSDTALVISIPITRPYAYAPLSISLSLFLISCWFDSRKLSDFSLNHESFLWPKISFNPTNSNFLNQLWSFFCLFGNNSISLFIFFISLLQGLEKSLQWSCVVASAQHFHYVSSMKVSGKPCFFLKFIGLFCWFLESHMLFFL